ncbi:MAG: DUF2971 domain-containing protein [Proteobacteria bacterium]|nr:DUF2971 domain-containing protein [Pseudomonadota bacterium]
MNDYSESHWAYDRFIEAVNLAIGDVGEDFVTELDERVSTGQLRSLPLVASFSIVGDLLSQWRSYANDGGGVAIGFDASKLCKLSTRNVEVIYSKEEQVNHFYTMIRASHDTYQHVPKNKRRKFLDEIGHIMHLDLVCFKNPAFSEEGEVRFMRAVGVLKVGESGWTLKDSGGQGERLSSAKLPIKFRPRANGIVAFIEMPIQGLGDNLIRNVVLGPKSNCNGVEISMALNAAGFRDAEVTKSSATYR